MKVIQGDIILDISILNNPYYVIDNPVYKTTKLLIELGFNVIHLKYEDPYLYTMYTKTINRLIKLREMVILFHWEEK